MAEKTEEYEIPVKKNIIWQLFLIILPWPFFHAVDDFYPYLLRQLFSARVPFFVVLAPFEILLVVGIVFAWKRNFPLWSYTWIGTLYFFGYREVFNIVSRFAYGTMPENLAFIVQGVFYGIINPLALAFLLALITRRDWLLACLTAYPFTSIIMAWYTLDKTPFSVLSVSLVLYGFFALLFLTLQSRTLKFACLLAGTLIVGGGFFLWKESQSFLFIVGRNVLILVFPLIIHKIPLYHKMFKTGQPAPMNSLD
mgnify:CR=1 FL=1